MQSAPLREVGHGKRERERASARPLRSKAGPPRGVDAVPGGRGTSFHEVGHGKRENAQPLDAAACSPSHVRYSRVSNSIWW